MPHTQANISIQTKNISKNFNRRAIFKDISFELSWGDSVAITGRNGSGKSTLIKILANVLNPTAGKLEIYDNSALVQKDDYYRYIGFVSPYLNLYDEFTGYENLLITTKIRGASPDNINDVLRKVGLYDRRNDLLRIYSSGMKQRLKLAFAVLHDPKILLLDEPTSNLDKEGIAVVTQLTNEQKQKGILLIATNDEYERSLCEQEININKLMGT
jgi:heme exporter protein A